MSKRGKKYQESAKLVDRNKLYEPEEVMELIKKTATASFDETIEVAIKLGVDPRHADQNVRGACVMPAGLGRTVKVVVFAKGDKADEAEAAGADVVGQDDLAARIKEGWMDFDLAIATPDMMSVVGRLGRILGPKGLMPNPKAGTVTFNVGEAVKQFKAGKIEYRVEKAGIIHAPIGKASFSVEDLMTNFNALVDALMRARPAAAKGQYMRSVSLSSTMGPSIKVNPQRVMQR